LWSALKNTSSQKCLQLTNAKESRPNQATNSQNPKGFSIKVESPKTMTLTLTVLYNIKANSRLKPQSAMSLLYTIKSQIKPSSESRLKKNGKRHLLSKATQNLSTNHSCKSHLSYHKVQYKPQSGTYKNYSL
jgi:hypothetical protein